MRCCLFIIKALIPLYVNGVEFSKWRSYDEINQFLDETVNKFSHVSVEVIGQSVEGRDIKVVKMKKGFSAGKIYIQAGIHAREWITSASVLYLINRLAEECLITDKFNAVCRFEWHIVPLVNPDGYEFSRLKEGQCPKKVQEGRSAPGGKGCRTWRKNRRLGVCTNSPASEGVDLNRNFGKFWKKETNKCSDKYGGQRAFSEPETLAVKKYIEEKIKPETSYQLKAAIDVHSYSEAILIPEEMSTSTKKRVEQIGESMKNAIKGKNYRVDTVSQFFDLSPCKRCPNSCRRLKDFRANGNVMDWIHHEAGVPDIIQRIDIKTS